MGHIRLKRLPATRKWREVVRLLIIGAPVEQVALASSDAAEAAFHGAKRDPVLASPAAGSRKPTTKEGSRPGKRDFAFVALGKIAAELKQRQAVGA